jgi:hypothetical protein
VLSGSIADLSILSRLIAAAVLKALLAGDDSGRSH